MHITVSGKGLNVGASLKEHVESNLEAAVSKYFDRAIDGDVVFSKESHLFCANIMVNEGTSASMAIKSEGKAEDIYAAFDIAVDRVEKQLRRYKRRIKNHKGKADMGGNNLSQATATKYVISDDGQDADEDDNPLIIAEKQTVIETITVSDAVMRMNLANLPALMFINKKTGSVNVVYRRHDGNISWVDSDNKQSSAA